MLIENAKECWENLSSFRKKRNRCRDFTFGRQWNDIIEINGRRTTEYEYILNEGNPPLQNNLIRRIVRNVLGVFRKEIPDIIKEEYSGNLELLARRNSLEELFSRSMEEFLISGMVVHRSRLCLRNGQPGVWNEEVSPASFFFNTDSRDIRGWDINLIGQYHKVSFNDWCRAFVKTIDDYKKARQIFPDGRRYVNIMEIWRKEMAPRYIFHNRETASIVRVDCRDRETLRKFSKLPRKWMMDEVWRYYFVADDGKVICHGDSPYSHRSHPYVMKCYPFLDGEIHSFVGDMIDQQKYANRLITLYDWVIRASAKGVLLLPEGSVDPKNYRDVADQWSRFNGVIVYKADAQRPEPKQINSNLSNLGISELLEIQLKMLEDVSGVNGVLQGNTIGGNVSGALYNSQTVNAMYSLSDLLQTFRSFIHECVEKDLCLMKQSHAIS